MSKQFATTRVNSAYWRVAFSHPPMNLVDSDTILEFQQRVGEIETDEDLRVLDDAPCALAKCTSLSVDV